MGVMALCLSLYSCVVVENVINTTTGFLREENFRAYEDIEPDFTGGVLSDFMYIYKPQLR